MPEDNRKDILHSELEYTCVSLISSKTKVIIIGGGKAGLIKTKGYANRGCNVWVLSKEFIHEFKEFNSKANVNLIKKSYTYRDILDKHLVIIAVNDESLNKRIVEDCKCYGKLFCNCTNFKEGIFVTPVQKNTKNIAFSIHCKKANPKLSLFLGERVEEELNKYDDFVKYTCKLRESIKNHKNKKEIMSFVSTEDFKFFFDKNVHEKVLSMFYGGNNFEFKNCNKKE